MSSGRPRSPAHVGLSIISSSPSSPSAAAAAGGHLGGAEAEDVAQTGYRTDVHLPAPSYWPIVLCFALPLIGYGLIFNLGFAFVGGGLTLMSLYGLALEPPDDPDAGHGHDDHHGDDGDEGAPEPAAESEQEEVTS